MESKKGIKEINPKSAYGWSVKTAIIAGIVLFSLLLPNLVYAQEEGGGIVSDIFGQIGRDIFSWLSQIVLSFFALLVDLAANVFENMLDIGFGSHKEIVEMGWGIVRDVTNMFFILFMIVIAFATILRIERYGIKQLLPKVIIIALLINFSLIISYVIIDFSDITARFFIDNARQGGRNISATFADSLNLTKIFLPTDCGKTYDQEIKKCEDVYGGEGEMGPPAPGDTDWGAEYFKCVQKAGEDRENCLLGLEDLKEAMKGKEATFINMIVSILAGSVVLLVAAFALFAGAILLLIRLIFLWFLVILVPFVFLCYIMPGLRTMWQKWWKTFLNWCFFAPIYAFFIWLAVDISVRYRLLALKSSIKQGAENQMLATEFFGLPDHLINFLFIIAFLLGGLIAAKQFGLYGAGAALNIAQKGFRGAKGWVARTSMRPVKTTATAVGAGALTVGGRLFGGKIGRRMQAKGAQIRQRTEERIQHKKYRALAERMSNKDLLKEVDTAVGIRKFIATREAAKRGTLREAERGTVRKAMKAMHTFGAPEAKRQLEELRPDAVEDKDERKDAQERAHSKGIDKQWSKKVFEGPRGAKVAGEMREQLSTDEFAKVFKGWAKDVQTQAEEALQLNFTDDFTDSDNLKQRRHYASVTGKIQKAFYGDQYGNIQKDYIKRAEPSLQSHIQGLTNEGIGKLDSDKDRVIAAIYMKPSQVQGAGAKLSGKSKEIMKTVAKNKNPDTFKEMRKSKGWGSSNLVDLSGATPEEKKEKAWQEAKEEVKKIEEEEE